MTTFISCDWCGQPIVDDDLKVTISVDGNLPPARGSVLNSNWERGYLGHYHTEQQPDQDQSCYRKVLDAIDLAHAAGPMLETIETRSGQWVAAQRRGFTRPGEDD